MDEIEYVQGGSELLDSIEFLWEKLNNLHSRVAEYFSNQFSNTEFKARKQNLVQKSIGGKLRIEIANCNSKSVGYCITTIDNNRVGEIDSIYIEERFRQRQIGHHFIQNAIQWMDIEKVAKKTVVVVSGNESVYPFYQKYGFYPRTSTLVQK